MTTRKEPGKVSTTLSLTPPQLDFDAQAAALKAVRE
jgi:hypothetical protein